MNGDNNGGQAPINDDELEQLLLDLIDRHLADKEREAVRAWLVKRVASYKAVQELGLLDDEPL